MRVRWFCYAREERDGGSPIREDKDIEMSETSDRDREDPVAIFLQTHTLQTLILPWTYSDPPWMLFEPSRTPL